MSGPSPSGKLQEGDVQVVCWRDLVRPGEMVVADVIFLTFWLQLRGPPPGFDPRSQPGVVLVPKGMLDGGGWVGLDVANRRTWPDVGLGGEWVMAITRETENGHLDPILTGALPPACGDFTLMLRVKPTVTLAWCAQRSLGPPAALPSSAERDGVASGGSRITPSATSLRWRSRAARSSWNAAHIQRRDRRNPGAGDAAGPESGAVRPQRLAAARGAARVRRRVQDRVDHRSNPDPDDVVGRSVRQTLLLASWDSRPTPRRPHLPRCGIGRESQLGEQRRVESADAVEVAADHVVRVWIAVTNVCPRVRQ